MVIMMRIKKVRMIKFKRLFKMIRMGKIKIKKMKIIKGKTLIILS